MSPVDIGKLARYRDEGGKYLSANVGRVQRLDILKCDEMVGIAGATIVTSTAARKFGRTKPAINFHRRIVNLLASCRSLSFSTVFSVAGGLMMSEDGCVGAAPELVRAAWLSFAVDGGDAYGDRCVSSAVEKDSFCALLSLTLLLMYLYSMYAIPCVEQPKLFQGQKKDRTTEVCKIVKELELEHRTLSVLQAASYTLIVSQHLCLFGVAQRERGPSLAPHAIDRPSMLLQGMAQSAPTILRRARLQPRCMPK
ncbi:hypothetical protein P171DRAFT_231553 [Karstenula rhodostoma CBS 690.94]|uniref:Uncharacterized protein n=1 Tax=Karstenula rhodostoma CBS 690.94 TaxID=1392251 RepID=A0A9P4PP23_9PLEO|nr:hypothetical protein P171DRAFT_231553 [Karstenula rhodostoma CBS 690.94]